MRAYRVRFVESAVADLTALQAYVGRRSGARAADHLIERLLAHCERFGLAPHRGLKRDDIRPGLRLIGWRRLATIAVHVGDETATVTIAGVFYRGLDIDASLSRR